MLTMMLGGENILNPLEGQMDELIETFVAVHGEDKREIITQRLKNTTFIFVPRSMDSSGSIKSLYLDKKAAIESEFYEKLGKPELARALPITSLYKLRDCLQNGQQDSMMVTELDELCKKLGIYEEVLKYREQVGFFKRDLDGHIIQQRPIKEFVASEETKRKLTNFLDSAIKLDSSMNAGQRIGTLNDEYKAISTQMNQIAVSEIKLKRRFMNWQDDMIEEYLLTVLGMTKEEFDKTFTRDQRDDFIFEYCCLLKRGREKFADNMTITGQSKRNCLELFHAMGFDLGEELSAYAESDEFMDLLFNKDLVEKREEKRGQCLSEIAHAHPIFVDAVKTIQGLDMQGGNLDYINFLYAYMFQNGGVGGAVLPYLTSDNKVRNICLLPISADLERTILLHECEHIIETSLIENEDGTFSIKSGFELHASFVCEEDYDGTNLSISDALNGGRRVREMEVLNETMVEMFAYMLLRKAEECGLMVGNPQVGSCWHAKMVRLFDGFVEYSDKLSDVRLGNDGHAFSKAFGTANILIMNEVANAYYKSIIGSGIKYSDFLTHVRTNTGQDLEEVDFLNLPDDLEWSESDKEFLTQHILLAKVLENLRSSMTQKNKHTESESGALN